jgi:hypothetical protein
MKAMTTQVMEDSIRATEDEVKDHEMKARYLRKILQEKQALLKLIQGEAEDMTLAEVPKVNDAE